MQHILQLALAILLLTTVASGSTLETLTIVISNATLPNPRAYAPAIYDGQDSIYVLGTLNTEGYVDIPKYSVDSDAVTTSGNFINIGFGNGLWTGNSMHYFGGMSLATEIHSEVWNIQGDPANVTVVGRLPTPNLDMAVAWDSQDNVYLFGGSLSENSNGIVQSTLPMNTRVSGGIIQYTLSTNTAQTLSARLPTPRYRSSAVWSPVDNKIYILGGSEYAAAGPYVDDILRFDPVTKNLTKLSVTLPRKSAFACTVSTGLTIYYIGAYHDANNWVNVAARFNPITLEVEELELVNPLGFVLVSHSCVLVEKQNRIYITIGLSVLYIQL